MDIAELADEEAARLESELENGEITQKEYDDAMWWLRADAREREFNEDVDRM